MVYVSYFLFWLLGIFLGSMGIVQILIVLLFSIPYTNKLHRQGVLTDKTTILKRDFMTIGIWFIILAVTLVLLYNFASSESINSVYIGMAFVVVLGLGKLRANEANVSDYFESNYRFIDLDALSKEDPILADMVLNKLNKVTEAT